MTAINAGVINTTTSIKHTQYLNSTIVANRLQRQTEKEIASAPIVTSIQDNSIDSDINDNHRSGQASSSFYVIKRDGQRQLFDPMKIRRRLEFLAQGLNLKFVNVSSLADQIARGIYPNISASNIVELSAETAASLSTQHTDYARLAARILVMENRAQIPGTFSEAIQVLYGGGRGFVSRHIAEIVKRRSREIDAEIRHERDYQNMTYFGFKTLERSYLLRHHSSGRVQESPQYLFMRVALGIHCSYDVTPGSAEEDAALQAAFETYDYMSRGFFTHASPTLFHSGTIHPQLSSCFLLQMSADSIEGIYDTLKRCAVISKAAGGIGLSFHNIRARGTSIRGTNGVSNGLVPALRVFDATSRYVDQGGGKRPGAIAIYLEPWHSDIFDVLNLKKNHGKEEARARDLFYGLWIPDLFMQRVEDDGMWSLMCPHQCPGLSGCYGKEFEERYEQYEEEGRFVKQIRARDLWTAILESQMETGTPYMLYKDACNAKSNQQNLGCIQCSNLCTEIIQYTDSSEVAVCNLASLCLPKFVVSSRGTFGSTTAVFNSNNQEQLATTPYFDHEALHHVTKMVTRNLNKVIDINHYPLQGAADSNKKHRPIGLGVSGLADCLIRLGLPFAAAPAKQLNAAIFETIYHAAVEASVELASEQGPYESFEGSPASQGQLQMDLWGITNDGALPSHKYSAKMKGKERKMGIADDEDDDFVFQKYPAQYRDKGYDWESLRKRVMETGMRNSLLVAPMPTASTSQILGVNECFEPFSSNMYLRRVKAGEFIMTNPHLLQDLTDLGLWTADVRNQLLRDAGSVQNIDQIPDRLKELYKTVWEIKMKDVIDMAADRGQFVDQSQSLNLFLEQADVDKLTAMHFYAWKRGLKTGMYYLRTKPAVNAIQYTVTKPTIRGDNFASDDDDDKYDDLHGEICLSCSA